MEILSADRIKLKATATDKMDAIRQAGELLVSGGCVKPNYVKGMLEREESMSTYLDNGVSIPHGQYDNRDDILKTGICVLQVPEGVLWEDDDKAYLIVGIAASSDEHIDVLSALSDVVEDDELVQQLIETDDKQLILSSLSKPAEDI